MIDQISQDMFVLNLYYQIHLLILDKKPFFRVLRFIIFTLFYFILFIKTFILKSCQWRLYRSLDSPARDHHR